MDSLFNHIASSLRSRLAGQKYKHDRKVVPVENDHMPDVQVEENHQNFMLFSLESDVESLAFYKMMVSFDITSDVSEYSSQHIDNFPAAVSYMIRSGWKESCYSSFLERAFSWHTAKIEGLDYYFNVANGFVDLSMSVHDMLKYNRDSFVSKNRTQFTINFMQIVVSIWH
jgi:hypothetical protein